MRRRHLPSHASQPSGWLVLDDLAEVAVSSEDPQFPIENALVEGLSGGWRAAGPGEQTVRLSFDQPLDISVLRIVFDEPHVERVQEFELRWSSDRGQTFRSIVRQQFTFSPGGATQQVETYQVELTALTDIDLTIRPDLSHRSHMATLTQLALR